MVQHSPPGGRVNAKKPCEGLACEKSKNKGVHFINPSIHFINNNEIITTFSFITRFNSYKNNHNIKTGPAFLSSHHNNNSNNNNNTNMVDINFPHETATTAPMRAQPPPPPFPTNLMQEHSHTLAVAVAIIGVLFMCTTGIVIASRHLKDQARQDNEKLSNLMIEMLELQTERQMENEAAYVKAKSLQNNQHISRNEPAGHKTYRFPDDDGTWAFLSDIGGEEPLAKSKESPANDDSGKRGARVGKDLLKSYLDMGQQLADLLDDDNGGSDDGNSTNDYHTNK